MKILERWLILSLSTLFTLLILPKKDSKEGLKKGKKEGGTRCRLGKV